MNAFIEAKEVTIFGIIMMGIGWACGKASEHINLTGNWGEGIFLGVLHLVGTCLVLGLILLAIWVAQHLRWQA